MSEEKSMLSGTDTGEGRHTVSVCQARPQHLGPAKL